MKDEDPMPHLHQSPAAPSYLGNVRDSRCDSYMYLSIDLAQGGGRTCISRLRVTQQKLGKISAPEFSSDDRGTGWKPHAGEASPSQSLQYRVCLPVVARLRISLIRQLREPRPRRDERGDHQRLGTARQLVGGPEGSHHASARLVAGMLFEPFVTRTWWTTFNS